MPAERVPGNAHIVLCGPSGAGKSTVGSLLARRLRRPFVDVDREIEREAGMNVRAIFGREGELAFRRRERAAVARLIAEPNAAVIALGGGALEHDETLADVKAQVLIWLDAPVWALAPRVMGNERPLLAGDPVARLRELAAAREPRYRQAHFTVDATQPPKAVAAAIAELVRSPLVAGGLP